MCSCGGGGSSDSGMVIEGQLTQGGGVAHSAALRHGAGENIENVSVCALGECSVTDSEGRWGFVAPEGFTGGEVLFNIDGHGLLTSTIVPVPDNASVVEISLLRVGTNEVAISDIVADGESVFAHDHDDHDHGSSDDSGESELIPHE